MVCRHVGAAAAGTDGGSGAGGEALYYARGGIAWANYRYTSFWGGERAFYEANQLKSGWAAGAGVEHVIAPGVTLNFDYTALLFGSSTVDLIPNRPIAPYRVDVGSITVNKISLGVNVHLEWGER